MRSLQLTLARAALLLAGLGASALACPAPAPAQTPAPDLAPMALQPADFPFGGKVTSVQKGSDGAAPTYQETLRVGDRAGGRPARGFALQYLEAADSPEAADADLAQGRRLFATPQGRRSLARQFAKGARGLVRAKDVRIKRPRTVLAGDGAFELRFSVRGLRVTGVFAFMRVDRVETIVSLSGPTGSRLVARRVSVLRAAARRIAAGLAPQPAPGP